MTVTAAKSKYNSAAKAKKNGVRFFYINAVLLIIFVFCIICLIFREVASEKFRSIRVGWAAPHYGMFRDEF
ncbi:MAG: hypothetical protein RQ733_07275 [Methyloprofundus sp.]|nr:hypothetical protein [Methyloprofundus sp.]MDT8425760.1 hypothetical protein [Methyloprofundus sp.]